MAGVQAQWRGRRDPQWLCEIKRESHKIGAPWKNQNGEPNNMSKDTLRRMGSVNKFFMDEIQPGMLFQERKRECRYGGARVSPTA